MPRPVASATLAFSRLTSSVDEALASALSVRDGSLASYIPELGCVDPDQFAVAVCTTDGSVYARGDTRASFCVQSCCKPVNYLFALEEHGVEGVHRHIGREPSGRGFSELAFGPGGRPHNPMINAGGIVVCSLIGGQVAAAERLTRLQGRWGSSMAAGAPTSTRSRTCQNGARPTRTSR